MKRDKHAETIAIMGSHWRIALVRHAETPTKARQAALTSATDALDEAISEMLDARLREMKGKR